jgi:hypothetical protein
MWLRAGVVVALFIAGLVPASGGDDGPPAYTPPPIDYADPLLMPTNPRTQFAVANPQPELPRESESPGQPLPGPDDYQRVGPLPGDPE